MPHEKPPGPDDLDALLAAWGGEGGAAAGGPDEASDALELAARLEASCAGLAAEDRRALADVADALAHHDPAARLSPSVRRAALQAYRAHADAPPRVGGVPRATEGPPPAREPLRPAAQGRGPATWIRVAALLLVALGVGLFLATRGEAGRSLRVAGVDRLAADGSRAWTGSARRLPVGTTLAGARGELLVVTLATGGRVLLGPGDEAAITGTPTADGHEARMRLVAGRVRADASEGPVDLEARGDGSLVLDAGRMELRCEDDGVLLLADAEASFRLKAEREARRGPITLLLTSGGVREHAPLPLEQSAFAPLDRRARTPAGDALLEDASARRWRVAQGVFERRGRVLELAPTSTSVRLAWRPSAPLRGATGLEVRARGGPAHVRLAGAQSPGVAVGDGHEDAFLPLPAGWFDALGGKELELEITWPGEPPPARRLRFLGATARRGASAPALDPSDRSDR